MWCMRCCDPDIAASYISCRMVYDKWHERSGGGRRGLGKSPSGKSTSSVWLVPRWVVDFAMLWIYTSHTIPLCILLLGEGGTTKDLLVAICVPIRSGVR